MDDIFVYLGMSSAVKLAIQYFWWDKRPRDMFLAGHVTKLSVFPVKSTREINLQNMSCSTERGAYNGVAEDRQFIIVTKDNVLASISQEGTLHRIQPRFDGPNLVLTSPGLDDVTVDIQRVIESGKVVTTAIQKSRISGLDCGEEVSKWLDDHLGKPGHKLLYSAQHLSRRSYVGDLKQYSPWTCEAKAQDKITYQDDSPLHLLSEESTADLNSRLDQSVDVMQFRPNIVVSASGGPYDEDTWNDVYIGEVRLRTIKLADRCSLPCVDRTSCTRYKRNEPLRTLKEYRNFIPGLGPLFGTSLVVDRPGVIHVGDAVYVTRGDHVTPP